MKTNEMRFHLALIEAQQSQARANHYAVRISSGLYKSRWVLSSGVNGKTLTEKELLQDEEATLKVHLSLADEFLDIAKKCIMEKMSIEKGSSSSKHEKEVLTCDDVQLIR